METIIFGKYPQGKNGEIAPLVWRVLDCTEKGIVIITEKIIDCKPFNENGKSCLWDTCSLRLWLENEFMSNAFSADEKERIQRIFLLNNEEVYKYFDGDEDRLAAPTDYAKEQGVLEYDGNKKSWWWSSTVNSEKTHAAFISYDGFLFRFGRKGNATNYGVRPAILLRKK